jgi:hypothetical protein
MTWPRITQQNVGFTILSSLLLGLLVLTGSCKSDGASSLYTGEYTEGMERMSFSPYGTKEDWWVDQPPRALQFLVEGPKGGSVLAVVEGERSEQGEYGHTGAYPHKLTIRRVLARQIPIPAREHGYNTFDSTVIGSPDELRTFLQRIKVDEAAGWNDPSTFKQAIKRAAIDFQHERLVIFRHTESSGSNRVTPRLSVSGDGILRFTIDRKVPEMGTADMAYYAFAFAVDTRRIKKAIKVLEDEEKEAFEVSPGNER